VVAETLYDPSTAGMTTSVENVDWNLGVKFNVTQPGALVGVQWFSGANGPTAPQEWKLWNAATPAQPLYEFNNPAPLQSRVADFALTMPLHLPVGVYVLAYRLKAGAYFNVRAAADTANPMRAQAAITPLGGVRQSPPGTGMPQPANFRYFVSPKFVTGQTQMTGQGSAVTGSDGQGKSEICFLTVADAWCAYVIVLLTGVWCGVLVQSASKWCRRASRRRRRPSPVRPRGPAQRRHMRATASALPASAPPVWRPLPSLFTLARH
jgi:hypothetical protein